MARSALFACNMNSIRSPMAAALLAHAAGARMRVDSAGVWEGALDPFVPGVLDEIGVRLGPYRPKPMSALDISGFDVVVALTPEAAAEARRLLPPGRVEYWDVPNPTDVRGDEATMRAAYRAARDDLDARLRARFPDVYAA